MRSLVGISMTAVTSVGGFGPVGMSCQGWKLRWGMFGTAELGLERVGEARERRAPSGAI